MSYLPFTILAYFLNCVSVLVDKFLLTKHIENPLVYVFYFSLYSLLVLVLLPFISPPTSQAFILASVSTILWTLGAYFLFHALKIGLASRVVPVIGTLIPTFLLLHSLSTNSLQLNQIWAVLLLILGLLFLTMSDLKGRINYSEVLLEILSALLFAFSYLALREAYLQSNFLSVLTYSRVILIPVGIALLLIPQTRNIVLNRNNPLFKIKSRVGVLFMVGQFAGGAAEILLTFSISLASPALVNSLQGTQYAFLFLLTMILSRRYPQIFKESLSKTLILGKIIGILLLGLGLYVLAFSEAEMQGKKIGFTYSPRYAESLDLDAKETYKKALDELKFNVVRVPVYWDVVEVREGQYNFDDPIFYVTEAQKKGVDVILVLGYKQPRWPECFQPKWAEKLSFKAKQDKLLGLIQKEVEVFKGYDNIKFWQVENEPFLSFGECKGAHPLNEEFVKTEADLVRSLDPRPILITESGELTSWKKSINIADVQGISLYRTVWNPVFGHFNYPFPPFFYSAKASIVKLLHGNKNTRSIVSELQTEPWVPAKEHIKTWDTNEQKKAFPPEKIQDNLNYAKETGFDEVLVWGVEWWYWMKDQGHPEYIETAKNLK